MSIKSKLALGTVQFGLDYGISNTGGIVNENEIASILKFASEHNIDIIDTAKGYGQSEENLGKLDLSDYRVITKIIDISTYKKAIEDSLSKLNKKKLYGVLVHNFDSFLDNEHHYSNLRKYAGVNILKIGFSLNKTSELDYLIHNKIEFDILQVPYNIFDQRFEKYFKELKSRNIEIHTRSVFLQGAFFLDPLPNHLIGLTTNMNKMKEYSKRYSVPVSSIALNFVINNRYINKVVIGITSANELKDNIDSLNYSDKVLLFQNKLKNMSIHDEMLILPMNWNRNE